MTFPGPKPDDLAGRLLVDTLAAEVTQAEDTLTRRQKRLNDALVKVYDGYTPTHDEHPRMSDSIPREHSFRKWAALIVIAAVLIYAWWMM